MNILAPSLIIVTLHVHSGMHSLKDKRGKNVHSFFFWQVFQIMRCLYQTVSYVNRKAVFAIT